MPVRGVSGIEHQPSASGSQPTAMLYAGHRWTVKAILPVTAFVYNAHGAITEAAVRSMIAAMSCLLCCLKRKDNAMERIAAGTSAGLSKITSAARIPEATARITDG